MSKYWRLSLALCVAALMQFAAPASAGIVPSQISTSVNLGTGVASFSILFDQVPDFFSTDGVGRQADSFQFYVQSQSPFLLSDFHVPPDDAESIIRGENIHLGDGIPVIWVDSFNPGPPQSGGWGPTYSQVSFSLVGELLTFDVPLVDLRDDDGVFWFRFGTYEFGRTSYAEEVLFQSGMTYTGDGLLAPLPEPGTMALLAIGLLSICGVRRISLNP